MDGAAELQHGQELVLENVPRDAAEEHLVAADARRAVVVLGRRVLPVPTAELERVRDAVQDPLWKQKEPEDVKVICSGIPQTDRTVRVV